MNISFKSFFYLPEGAEIKNIIFTTMSMDISTTAKMLSLAFYPDTTEIKPGTIRPWIEKNKNKIMFFYQNNYSDKSSGSLNLCDANAVNLEPDIRILLKQLCYPVKCKNVFHPKIILLRYCGQDGLSHYRLHVSSKNITESKSFECGIQLCGEIVNNCSVAANHNLSCFFDFLSKQEMNDEQAAVLKDISGELEKVIFYIPDSNSKVQIFVSGEELGIRQDDELINQWENDKRLFILSPDYETGQKQFELHHIYGPVNDEDKFVPTHAKLYYLPQTASDDKTGTLWIGSCNSSEAAMNKNIECMARIDNVANKVFHKSDDDTLSVFGYKCIRLNESRLKSSDFNLEWMINAFISAHKFSGTDSKAANGCRQVSVEILNIDKEWSIPEGTNVELLPLGMSESSGNATKWKSVLKDTKIHFRGAKNESRTGWLRIRLSSKDGSVERQICFSSDAENEIISGVYKLNYETFLNRCWLEDLFRCEEQEEYEVIKREFDTYADYLMAESEEIQRDYIKNIKRIFEKSFKAISG